ncbi:hypothetical protein I3760_14G008500 [Carya illinoinensis]|nr:hypothetical protein I3760_14G008500 [Carya illinoinensis]
MFRMITINKFWSDDSLVELLQSLADMDITFQALKCTIAPLGNGWINDGKRLNNKKPRGRVSKRRNQGLVAVLGGRRLEKHDRHGVTAVLNVDQAMVACSPATSVAARGGVEALMVARKSLEFGGKGLRFWCLKQGTVLDVGMAVEAEDELMVGMMVLHGFLTSLMMTIPAGILIGFGSSTSGTTLTWEVEDFPRRRGTSCIGSDFFLNLRPSFIS